MQIPVWAREDAQSRLTFFCGFAALQCGPNGLVDLARVSGVNRQTIYNSIRRGAFSVESATSISNAVNSCIPFHWLVAPMSAEVSTGEAVK